MTEDDGYQTIVPDMSGVKVEQADRKAANRLAVGHPYTCFDCADELATSFAHHRQAAYNQALKDAAAVVMRAKTGDFIEDAAKAILSLGDKGNG